MYQLVVIYNTLCACVALLMAEMVFLFHHALLSNGIIVGWQHGTIICVTKTCQWDSFLSCIDGRRCICHSRKVFAPPPSSSREIVQGSTWQACQETLRTRTSSVACHSRQFRTPCLGTPCNRNMRRATLLNLAHSFHSLQVIYLLDVQKNASECNLLFPFYDKTLLDFVSGCDQGFAFNAVYQLAQGLDFLHNQGIIHCDLSPSNVLVDSTNNNHMVIADFGCAHFIMQHVTDDSAPSNDMEEQDNEEIGTLYVAKRDQNIGKATNVDVPIQDLQSTRASFWKSAIRSINRYMVTWKHLLSSITWRPFVYW